MSYGDYHGPNKADKGQEGGSCNRTLCQAPDAIWYNHGSRYWYCQDCRRDIQFDHVNLRNWELYHDYPMFETRKMWDARLMVNMDYSELEQRVLQPMHSTIYEIPYYGDFISAKPHKKHQEHPRSARRKR